MIRKTAPKKTRRPAKEKAVRQGGSVPAFELKDQAGVAHRLDKGQSDYTVIFFYPKDDTPGCTIEARGFSSDLKSFAKFDTRIFGISGGSEKSKAAFCAKHGLHTIMLADADFAVAKGFGVYGQKSFMGKKSVGIRRTTFLLDRNLKVVKIFERVDTKFHPGEVLQFISERKQLAGKSQSAKRVKKL